MVPLSISKCERLIQFLEPLQVAFPKVFCFRGEFAQIPIPSHNTPEGLLKVCSRSRRRSST